MLNTWKTVLVVLVLMLVVDSYLFYRYHRSLSAEASSARIEPVAATAFASAPEPPTPKLAGVTWVTLRVTDAPSWLRVISDGTVVYEQIAPPGYSQSFEARDSLRVWTGNAGSVEVEVDGRDLGALGVDREVLTRELVADPEYGAPAFS
jgi:Domain of unknown function (DUF4115)